MSIDIASIMIKNNIFVFYGEVIIIAVSAMYLIWLLMFRYGKEANLWIIIGILPLCVFMMGFFLGNDNNKLMGIIILMNRWDKIKKALKHCKTCCKQLAIVNSDSLSA